MELQDLLIDRFVEHREAVAEAQEERVKTVEAEIDSLLREKEEIEKWAAVVLSRCVLEYALARSPVE